VLLRHLAHELRLAVLGDGVVHLNAAGLSAADLLQSLYEAFYETSVPFKPTTTQIRLALQGKRALLLVDGPRFDGGGIEPLLDAAPESVLVVTARERHLLGEGRSIALPGLPAGDALALIERELGRSLTGAERPHAEPRLQPAPHPAGGGPAPRRAARVRRAGSGGPDGAGGGDRGRADAGRAHRRGARGRRAARRRPGYRPGRRAPGRAGARG
jgi:hypothetical protein